MSDIGGGGLLTNAYFKEEGILSWCLKRLKSGQPKMCSTVRESLTSSQWSHERGKRFDRMWECVRRVWPILSLVSRISSRRDG